MTPSRIRCWWFGCEGHPQDPAPPDYLGCMHCGDIVPYGDMVGDTRHNRMVERLRWVKWKLLESWRPTPCPACGKRGECADDCDGIPF